MEKYKAGYLIEVQNRLAPKFSRMMIERAGEVWYENTIKPLGVSVHRCLGTPAFESPEAALQWKKDAEEWLEGTRYRVDVCLAIYNVDGDPDCPYYFDLIKEQGNYYALYENEGVGSFIIGFDELEIEENLGREG